MLKCDIADGAKHYYYPVTNSRGDIMEIHNGPGQITAKYNYDAWGKLLSVTDANGNVLPKTHFAYKISVRYRGYEYDAETGLYYLQSRYYDPETGRFINADDANFIGITNSEVGYNLFAYCENNPVNYSDSSGYVVTPANVIGAVIGGIVGAVGGYFLTRWLADKLQLTGWKRNAFIGGLTAVITASAGAIGYFIGPYLARAGSKIISSLKTIIKRVGFKSLGSTGRTQARNLLEQLAMKQVKSNPLKWGKQLTRVVLQDSRWHATAGWVKMEAIIKTSKGKVIIHFVYNTVLKVFDDFKFK